MIRPQAGPLHASVVNNENKSGDSVAEREASAHHIPTPILRAHTTRTAGIYLKNHYYVKFLVDCLIVMFSGPHRGLAQVVMFIEN